MYVYINVDGKVVGVRKKLITKFFDKTFFKKRIWIIKQLFHWRIFSALIKRYWRNNFSKSFPRFLPSISINSKLFLRNSSSLISLNINFFHYRIKIVFNKMPISHFNEIKEIFKEKLGLKVEEIN